MNVSGLGQHAATQVANAGNSAVVDCAWRAAERPTPGVTVGVTAGSTGDDDVLKGIDAAALERALSGNDPLDRLLDRAFKSEGLVAPEMPAFES